MLTATLGHSAVGAALPALTDSAARVELDLSKCEEAMSKVDALMYGSVLAKGELLATAGVLDRLSQIADRIGHVANWLECHNVALQGLTVPERI